VYLSGREGKNKSSGVKRVGIPKMGRRDDEEKYDEQASKRGATFNERSGLQVRVERERRNT